MPTYSLKVDDENSRLRLDVFLAKALSQAPSRSFIKRLIDSGKVSVNQKSQKAHYLVAVDDEVSVVLEEEDMGHILPENIPLDILYEDEDILIIDKPQGLMVHPAPGVTSGTLVNALLFLGKSLSDFYSPFRPGIVHRLDRETSGVLIVAKNNKAHANLSRQFEERLVEKKYIAIVNGIIEFDEGIIDAPIGTHPRHKDKKAVRFDDAREASTVYRVVKRFADSTLVALYPETGRTHQLRVHLSYLGHPILGDDKYGKKKSFSRLMLHAQSIKFCHPQNHQPLEFSTEIPPVFKSVS